MHDAGETHCAFSSVGHIMRDVISGWLIRFIHANIRKTASPLPRLSLSAIAELTHCLGNVHDLGVVSRLLALPSAVSSSEAKWENKHKLDTGRRVQFDSTSNPEGHVHPLLRGVCLDGDVLVGTTPTAQVTTEAPVVGPSSEGAAGVSALDLPNPTALEATSSGTSRSPIALDAARSSIAASAAGDVEAEGERTTATTAEDTKHS